MFHRFNVIDVAVLRMHYLIQSCTNTGWHNWLFDFEFLHLFFNHGVSNSTVWYTVYLSLSQTSSTWWVSEESRVVHENTCIHVHPCVQVWCVFVCVFCLHTVNEWLSVSWEWINMQSLLKTSNQAIIWRVSSLDCKGLFSLSSPTCISLSPALI